MFDIKWIRETPEALDRALARRGLPAASAQVLDVDRRHREALTRLQEMQARRNEASKEIGEAKRRGEDAADLMAEVAALKDSLQAAEAEARRLGEELEGELAVLPNVPADDVPDGPDESANVTLREVGDTPAFDFTPKQHFELGEALGLLDFETSAKLSGSRFVVMRGAVARLHRALAQFMIDRHTRENGYTEVAPPYLVRDHVLYGTGQLPKFLLDQFTAENVAAYIDADKFDPVIEGGKIRGVRFKDKADEERFANLSGRTERKIVLRQDGTIKRLQAVETRWLIPTAEVPLTNLVAGEILEAGELPMRVTALTPCFRSEAGAAGKDTRGMLRQHQFDKVELVSVTEPDGSEAELERMTACAEGVLQLLGLPYRVVVLSTGDMGFSARKTYDIEVWLPGQGAYREISSCSNCGDFQARRMKARYRPPEGKGTRFVHTLNGSGVAVGRALIAVMENHQTAEGAIRVPEVLRPYMGGVELIGADA